MKPTLTLLFVFLLQYAYAQIDSTQQKKLQFTGDFRARIEHDWNSQNQQGIQRNDRSRLRYRFRLGANYQLDKHSSFGGRLRSGNINDQQGPHVTLGGGNGEFGLVRIGLEKLFYQFENKHIKAWIGKNTMPLTKLNELFWNDNVFPEGIAGEYHSLSNQLSVKVGHFVIKSNNKLFTEDSYLQIAQVNAKLWKNRIELFPGFYYFKQVGNYPDGQHTFLLDYAIFHLGSKFKLSTKYPISIGAEWYNNLTDYSAIHEMNPRLNDQHQGLVLSAQYGQTKKKGDWLLALTYAYMEKYAIVDYFAQNDWSRWDYSAVDAAGSRISNFKGVEIKIGYALKQKYNLILRSYFVEQLIKEGDFLENGNRIRLDLNIGF